MEGSNAPPGWYPDPRGEHSERFWNGSAWTEEAKDRQTAEPDRPVPSAERPRRRFPGFGEGGHSTAARVAVAMAIAVVLIGAWFFVGGPGNDGLPAADPSLQAVCSRNANEPRECIQGTEQTRVEPMEAAETCDEGKQWKKIRTPLSRVATVFACR